MMAYIEGEDTFNEKYRAIQNVTWDIYEIVSGANDILCSGIAISEKVLEITISGPALAPLTVIDLPGYINTTVDGQDRSIIKTIHDINTKYISDTRTIILAVVPANVDLNNIYVLGEAEKYDSNFERTVPIVTKPDTVEPDLLPSLIDIILNKRKYMKLGYLVMRNSSFKDIELDWEESRRKEDEFFRSSSLWNQVPEARKGRLHVKRFLGDLLYNHIRKELPNLKRDILDLIDGCEKEIQEMGLPVTDLNSAKIRYIGHIVKLQKRILSLLDGQYDFEYINGLMQTESGRKDSMGLENGSKSTQSTESTERPNLYFIRAGLKMLYQEYDSAMSKDQHILNEDKIGDMVLQFQGIELPGFVSFNTFVQIYSTTIVKWRLITKEHIGDIRNYLHKAISKVIALGTDPLLGDLFLSEFDQFYRSQVVAIDGAIRDIFDDEYTPFTLNDYYYETILSQRKTKVEDQIKKTIGEFQIATGSHSTTEFTSQLASLTEVGKLDGINYNESLAVQDLQEKLVAYCKVARKRIVDITLLQTIERHLVKRISDYFDKLIAVDDSAISSRLIEPVAKTARRQELQERVEVLQKSLHEL